ncbi:MAG TPA: hypothetical protein VK982_05435, partial [Bacteroidales bacterium]|nr:hypothetical protein [Bacteroidales bacterium]
RAEYRILLRQDNADIRLTELGNRLGLVSSHRFGLLKEKIKYRDNLVQFIKNYSVSPGEINPLLQQINSSVLKQKRKLVDVLLRPEVSIKQLEQHVQDLKQKIEPIPNRKEEIVEAAEVLIKYSGYIEREQQMADKLKRLEHIKIPPAFDYGKILSLSTEARQKLKKINPINIGQAARISGVSPSDVSVLLVYMGR